MNEDDLELLAVDLCQIVRNSSTNAQAADCIYERIKAAISSARIESYKAGIEIRSQELQPLLFTESERHREALKGWEKANETLRQVELKIRQGYTIDAVRIISKALACPECEVSTTA